MKKNILIIVYAAMFAALTCVATMIIKVPTVGTQGYVNIGDTLVLLSSWILGVPYGAIAAGIGSGLADMLSGYPAYIPGTTIIKFLMALVAFIILKAFDKLKAPKIIGYIVSGIVAELIMVFGYFAYESTLLGYGLAAAVSIPSNFIQAGTCLVLAVILIAILTKIPAVNSMIKKIKK